MPVDLRQIGTAFFDTKAVTDAVDKGTRKALGKFGAFVRTRAKSSIRTRKQPSAPGQPPSSHEGSLKRLIFFALDRKTKSLVVGPVPHRRGEAPRLLEHGGDIVRQRKSGARRQRYAARPFMAPAAKAEMPKFADLLRGMVH